MVDLIEARGPFINGKFTDGEGETFAVEDPSTLETLAKVKASSIGQMSDAIDAARTAFDSGPWPQMSVDERVDYVKGFVAALASRRDSLIETVIAETGCPRRIADVGHIDYALNSAREIPDFYSSLPEWEHNELPFDEYLPFGRIRVSVRRYEPIGVVAAITPYNFPIITNVWKVVPALLTGCTVILRPSPLAPLESMAFGDAAVEAGLPAGVLNVVAEGDAAGGELLSSHPAVDLVSFTGSVSVGKAIAVQAGATLKRVVLELGGKSVQLHLPDVFDGSIDNVVGSVMSVFAAHAGQGCALQTRVLVPAEHKITVLDALAEAVPSLVVGDPRDRATDLGPVITAAHRARVAGLVDEGVAAGARVVVGGDLGAVPSLGWFYPPTVLDIDDNSNPVAQREVFGPVVTVQGYRDADEAVAIANDTEYGLSNAVYTNDLTLGERLARRLRSGTVQVNQGAACFHTAMGGYKQSGIGRERGLAGVRAFQEMKHVVVGNR